MLTAEEKKKADKELEQITAKVLKEKAEKEKKVKVKLKEYDEILCSKKSCGKKLKVEDTLTMVDGRRGYLTCTCGHRTKVVKTRPANEDYNVDKEGTRTRKNPKLHMSKKARRKMNKELRDDK